MEGDRERGSRGYEALRRYLERPEWHVAEDPGRWLFSERREGPLCPIRYFFRVIPERCELLFFVVPEIEVPDWALAKAAEYLCRVNSGLRIGCFELDFTNGHVRLRSSLSFAGCELDARWIDAAVAPALRAFDEYFEGLARVLAGLATPREAIAAIDYGPERDRE